MKCTKSLLIKQLPTVLRLPITLCQQNVAFDLLPGNIFFPSALAAIAIDWKPYSFEDTHRIHCCCLTFPSICIAKIESLIFHSVPATIPSLNNCIVSFQRIIIRKRDRKPPCLVNTHCIIINAAVLPFFLDNTFSHKICTGLPFIIGNSWIITDRALIHVSGQADIGIGTDSLEHEGWVTQIK